MSIELKCTKRVKNKKRGKPSGLCGAPAAAYEVLGKTFTARAVLCDAHVQAAMAEGYTLKIIHYE